MKAQQACYFLQIYTETFAPSNPESVSKLWRHCTIDAKSICWYVVVGGNTEVCTTLLMRWSHWFVRWVVALFVSLCEPVHPKLPHSRKRSSSYTPAWTFVLFLLKH